MLECYRVKFKTCQKYLRNIFKKYCVPKLIIEIIGANGFYNPPAFETQPSYISPEKISVVIVVVVAIRKLP